jgi:hypothetical protein
MVGRRHTPFQTRISRARQETRIYQARRELPLPDGALSPMTICIAAIYREPAWGHGILTASDRMLTSIALGVEYEPGGQGKWALVTPRVMVMVADDLDIHTEVIRQIHAYIRDAKTPPTTYDIARKYSDYLVGLKSERAVRYALGSNYGFSAEQFAKLQNMMDQNVVARLNQDIQDYEQRINAQAIITGCDEDNSCHIYHVDPQGNAHIYDDVGFLCIGAGRNQANTQFLQHGYSNRWLFHAALLLVYAAKKSAETSPGVGLSTDMSHISGDRPFGLPQIVFDTVSNIYVKYDKRRKALEQKAALELYNTLLRNAAEHAALTQATSVDASSAEQVQNALEATVQSEPAAAQCDETRGEIVPPKRRRQSRERAQ